MVDKASRAAVRRGAHAPHVVLRTRLGTAETGGPAAPAACAPLSWPTRQDTVSLRFGTTDGRGRAPRAALGAEPHRRLIR